MPGLSITRNDQTDTVLPFYQSGSHRAPTKYIGMPYAVQNGGGFQFGSLTVRVCTQPCCTERTSVTFSLASLKAWSVHTPTVQTRLSSDFVGFFPPLLY